MILLSHPPEWHKKKVDDAGWIPCPEGLTCPTCKRSLKPSRYLCCGAYRERKKYLQVASEGTVWYEAPTQEEMLEYINELENVIKKLKEK